MDIARRSLENVAITGLGTGFNFLAGFNKGTLAGGVLGFITAFATIPFLATASGSLVSGALGTGMGAGSAILVHNLTRRFEDAGGSGWNDSMVSNALKVMSNKLGFIAGLTLPFIVGVAANNASQSTTSPHQSLITQSANVAPSSKPCDQDRIREGIKQLEGNGFRVTLECK
jgi:hypothetical protein